ncbi:hypothetical protein F5Y16DRAFT_406177 [Xylariaceae sp. FL0255]|nr:hypothetical protein F5Y16DRAFT_406177 [Xylariaceae sp. FL0255]
MSTVGLNSSFDDRIDAEHGVKPSHGKSPSEAGGKDLRVVMCADRKMMVKPNLYEAPLQLRKKASGDNWIDAVCMNQRADNEKSHPFWGGHLKHIPTLFEPRHLVQSGAKGTLEEWLGLSRGRRATDTRDFLNAGLGLVKQESLVIDSAIQINRDDPSGRHEQKLWPYLHAQSKAGMFEVMLNLAACLLSQTQKPSFFFMANLDSNDELPTWFPNPESMLSRTDSISLNKDAGYAACRAADAKPQISHDGRTLYLQASRVGTVKQSIA